MNNQEKMQELLGKAKGVLDIALIQVKSKNALIEEAMEIFDKALALLKQELPQTVFIVTENHQSDSNVTGVFTENPLADAEAAKNVGDALYGCSVHEWTVQDCVSPAEPCGTCGGSGKKPSICPFHRVPFSKCGCTHHPTHPSAKQACPDCQIQKPDKKLADCKVCLNTRFEQISCRACVEPESQEPKQNEPCVHTERLRKGYSYCAKCQLWFLHGCNCNVQSGPESQAPDHIPEADARNIATAAIMCWEMRKPALITNEHTAGHRAEIDKLLNALHVIITTLLEPDHTEADEKVDVSEFVAKIRQDLEYSCTWIGMNKDIRELCDRLEAAKKEIEKWMAMVEKSNAWYDKAMDAMKKSNDFKTKLEAANKRADAAENVNDIREAEIEQLHDKLQTSDELVFAYQSVNWPINPLFAKLKTAEGALKRYGEHETGCMKGDACNCGLAQALGEGGGSDG